MREFLYLCPLKKEIFLIYDMDKNTGIGLLLIGAVLFGWFYFMQPSKEEIAKEKEKIARYQDSIAAVQKQINDSIALVEANKPVEEIDSAQTDSVAALTAANAFGLFSEHAVGQENFITVENDKFILTFSTKGATLVSAKLKDYHTYKNRFIKQVNDTLDLIQDKTASYGFDFSAKGKNINTSNLFFEPSEQSIVLSGEEIKSLSFKAYVNGSKDKYIEYLYTFTGNNYMLDFNIQFQQMNQIIDPQSKNLPFAWNLTAPSQERHAKTEREKSTIYYATAKKNKVSKIKRGGGAAEKTIDEPVKWISFHQQFFSTAIISKNAFDQQAIQLKTAIPANNDSTNMMYNANWNLPYAFNESESIAMQMYVGPNHYNTLKKYDLNLEDQIDLGMFALFSVVNKWLIIPVFNFFDSFNLNYGLIILLLTVIIKILLSPVQYKTYVSSAKMRILKPEVDELNAKFPKTEQALQKQQAMMALYKKAGVSPFAGCIPSLLQMPILIAMFSFFPSAIELRQQGFLWAEDLSSYDSILKLPFNIPFYGDHVSLFTLLMTATTMIFTAMNSSQMNMSGPQAKQMKIMMYVMPILFLGVLNSYSSALSYYYFLSNVIGIILILIIRNYVVNEDKLRLQIEENKKKPVKKSKFQARLEEVQKMQEERMKNNKKK